MSKHNFPRKIWQVWQTGEASDSNIASVKEVYSQLISSWKSLNPNLEYTLVDNHTADALVRQKFGHIPKFRDTFLCLKHPILRADVLRLLILYAEGGLYTDLDTEAVKPVDNWPIENFSDDVELVVGIEYDNIDGTERLEWPDDLQFATWTILAKSHSPILKRVIDEVIDNISEEAAQQQTSIEQLAITADIVLEITGPRAFTRAVLRALSEFSGMQVSHKDFTLLDKPRTLARICVLPVTAFACEQPHSLSGSWRHPAVLVIHKYHHSWKEQKNMRAEDVKKLFDS